MKGQVAASAVAFASLKREGFVPAGDLLFVSVADEEVGGLGGHDGYGLRWLVQAHPDAVRCDYAINEGAGDRLVLGGAPLRMCHRREDVRSRSPSASAGERARLDAGDRRQRARQGGALRRHASGRTYPSHHELIPEAVACSETVLGEAPPAEEAVAPRGRAASAAGRDRPAAPLAHSLPDDDRGVAPAERRPRGLRGHRRLPAAPRADAGRCRAADPGALGEGDYELEWEEAVGGTRSPLDTPLWDALAAFTAEIEPGARLAPIASPGSPTATTCGRRTARSHTASSRPGRWTPRRRRSSSTRRTSGPPSTTSSSASTCCVLLRCRSSADGSGVSRSTVSATTTGAGRDRRPGSTGRGRAGEQSLRFPSPVTSRRPPGASAPCR